MARAKPRPEGRARAGALWAGERGNTAPSAKETGLWLGKLDTGFGFSPINPDLIVFTRLDFLGHLFEISTGDYIIFSLDYATRPEVQVSNGNLVIYPGTVEENILTRPSGAVDADENLVIDGTVIQRAEWMIDHDGHLVLPDGIVLQVPDPPPFLLFDSHPVSISIAEGGTGEFSAEVDEGRSPSFRWQASFDGGETFSNVADGVFFGATVSGTHSDTLTVSSASLMLDGMIFRVRVTADETVEFSDPATLSVVTPSLPVFLASPASRTVEEQSAADFSVSVGGFPEPSVRWQVSTDGGASFADLAEGAPYLYVGTSTLTVDPVELAMDGHRFRAVAENSAGTVQSTAASLTVTPLSTPPAIIDQPEDVSARAGETTAISVSAEGHPVPAYQWQISFDGGGSFGNITDSSFGGGVFAGAQTPELTILAVDAFFDGAVFRARVSNSEGEVFSAGARLILHDTFTLDEWLDAAGVPAGLRGPSDRHGPLQLTNLEAYGMGLFPFEATAADLPRMERTDDGSGVLRFHYTVNTRAEGVSVSIKGSTDLEMWFPAEPVEETVHWEEDGVERREAVFAADILFLRLRVGEPMVDTEPDDMVFVEGGTLSTTNELNGTEVDTFYIGRYEVTWGEWREVQDWGEANGYEWPSSAGLGCTDDHPVHTVNWFDALKWCNAKSEMKGLTPVYTVSGAVYRSGEPDHATITQNLSANGVRLPLEAEWEFAARGGNQTSGYIYAGSDDLDAVGWYRENSGGAVCSLSLGRGIWPVGQKAANELGLYDMSGNVWELVWDRWSDTSFDRLVRGGSWGSFADGCTVSLRYSINPVVRGFNGGLRLARTYPDSVEEGLEEMAPVEGGTLSTSTALDGTEVATFYIGRQRKHRPR